MDNVLLRTLRARRIALRLSKQAVAERAGMNRGTFERRENTCRCSAIEQFERWAGTLGYRVTLVPVEDERVYWS